tara:strand:- start:200 stop:1672 length:1473 start_codon:yes stop_codon:yes gene_type:complete
MSILPINNVINVSITNTPSGATERNVNSLGLLTHEASLSLNPYEVYVSASQVAEHYGTASLTAQMATAIFSQTPNLRTGSGRLVIIPMQSAVSATAGDFTTADISANEADIKLVSSGDLKVVINGVDYNLTALNFTNATDFVDIATILQGRLVDATVIANPLGVRIESKKVGALSDVTIGSVSGGTGIDLSGAGYLNGAGGTETSGVNSSGETILDAVARTEGSVGYVPILTSLAIEDDALIAISNGIQALDKMFHYAGASTQDIAGVATDIQQATNTKTRFKVYTAGIEDAILMNAAYAGRAHSVNFFGSDTAQTMNLKSLATITPDDGITQTLYGQAEIAGCDLYVSYDGVASVLSTGGNDYFDNVYSDLALKFALETGGFNHLRQTNTKVPQTEQGMDGLKAAYSTVLDRFVRNRFIRGGSWTSSETFGDPEIFKQNILDKGYYVYSLPITQQEAVQREQRKAPLVQIAVKRAGAIHTSDVIVLIND